MAGSRMRHLRTVLAILLAIMSVAAWQQAEAFTLNVQGCASGSATCVSTPVAGGFRYIVEEDNTYQAVPGVRADGTAAKPFGTGLQIHNGHARVVATGTVASGTTAVINVPADKAYYVSVLPIVSGWSVSGVMVPVGAGAATVKVQQNPIPTAQISVIVFEDHNPINNVMDAGENGLPGWNVIIYDQGGQMTNDAFGNPIGTIYNPDGSINTPGDGTTRTCTAAEVLLPGGGPKQCSRVGEAVIKNIPPGKYGIRATPAPGENPALWSQTSTIEGTPGIDGWVTANEPKFFIEGFGTGFYHAFIGFVYFGNDTNNVSGLQAHNPLPWIQTPPLAGSNVTGVNRYNHFGAPPVNQQFVVGPPVPECIVGVNDLASGQGLYATRCDANSAFTIPNVPAGNYQLVTWDRPLIALFGFNALTVDGTAAVNLGNVLSFRWFGTLKGSIFFDTNENGFRDPGETGISSMAVNLRFRDGSIYLPNITDGTGEYEFPEVFPFFKWLVTEVDFLRMKPTGLTYVVDAGGGVNGVIPAHNGWTYPSFDALIPQPQVCVTGFDNDGNPCTIGAAINNPNTGNNLSVTQRGVILTKAQMLFLNQTNYMDWGKTNYAAGENGGISGVIGYQATRAEDDPTFAANDAWEPGIPNVQVVLYRDSNGDGIIDDLNGNGSVTLADVDNYPFGWADGSAPRGPEDVVRCGDGVTFCAGDALRIAWSDSFDANKPTGCIQTLPAIPGIQPCFDNYGTWNQIRDGVFDGGYAFGGNNQEGDTIPAGQYIVEAVPPPGYEIQKEEDKNVVFGDTFVPGPLAFPGECVGNVANGYAPHVVPSFLALFPDQAIPSFRAGQTTPLCSMRKVALSAGQNLGVDFHMFTAAPKAARVVGFSNNDLTAEFRAASPIFGEKSSPSWLPISFQDWQGNEVAHVYMDEFGNYEALVPSLYTANTPAPTGISPNMIIAVLNYPLCSPIHPANCKADGTDKFYNPQYGITPWTRDFWPGKTTYLDTPLLPIAAFSTFPQNGPDVEFPSGTPVISEVNGTQEGPLVCTAPTLGTEAVTITAAGNTEILNPDYDPAVAGSLQFLIRDYGFGSVKGTVQLGGSSITGAAITSWTNSAISFNVPAATAAGRYQLMVTRGDNGKKSVYGVTVHVQASCTNVKYAPAGGTIQDVIDAAVDGDIVLVKKGIYSENLFLYKQLILQGVGAGSSAIFATPAPESRVQNWHAKAAALLGTPGADPFAAIEAPGILVLSGDGGAAGAGRVQVPAVPEASDPVLIDGLRIFGTISGGAVNVYQGVSNLTVSNMLISANQGNLGGGITFGVPGGPAAAANENINARIMYNSIIRNGGVQGGGAVVFYPGSTNYLVEKNWIGGNLSQFYGAGVSHVGLSDGGTISKNTIIFNEITFGGAAFSDGAGIFIGGETAGADGSGSVTIDGNLIQGNLAGVGRGAGIMLLYVNSAANTTSQVTITNNMIVNNVAGFAAGAIGIQDSINTRIVNNTIANNASTATAANAFPAGTQISTPQGAGIVTYENTWITAPVFSNPLLENNIIWNNLSYHFDGSVPVNPLDPTVQLISDGTWDLQVNVPAATLQMSPVNCLLTSLTTNPDGATYSGSGNISGNPLFVKPYVNTLYARSVVDEGGNAITIRFLPLRKSAGEYHIKATSPAVNAGTALPTLAVPLDIDGEARPNGATAIDIGADEMYQATVPGVVHGIGVFMQGQWYLDSNGNGVWEGGQIDRFISSLGSASGAVPIAGDWTGDGTTKVGAFLNGSWYLDWNGNGAWDGEPADKIYTGFGSASGAIPVTGDWTGTGTAKIGVFLNGSWYLDWNGNGLWEGAPNDKTYTGFGTAAGARPVTGDWDRSGISKIGVFLNGQWYLDLNGNGVWDESPVDRFIENFGSATGAIPVTGDWNADGRIKVGVFLNGSWYLDMNGDGIWNGTPLDGLITNFGSLSGVSPIVGVW